MAFFQQFFDDLRTPLYKNALYLMMNTIVAGSVGLIFWIVVARYYSANEVGLAAAMIPVLVLIGLLSTFGFEAGLVRFLPSCDKDSGAMINSCLTISGVAAVLVSFIFLMGLEIWSPALLFIRGNWVFFTSFILFSVAFTLLPLMNGVFLARRNAKYILAGNLISGLRIVLPVLFVIYFGAFGILASWSVAILIALIVGIFVFIPMVEPGYRPIPTVKMKVLSNMIRFSAGNYVAEIFGALPVALLPLIIVHTLPAENAAYYYIAFTIAGLLFAITYAVCMSLFAEGSYAERELKSNVYKALKLIFLLLVPAVTITVLFGDYLLLLFGAEYVNEAVTLLRVFAISSIFMAINIVFWTTRRILKRLKPLVAISAFNAFAILGFSYVLIQVVGVVGAAVAWTLSQGIISLGIGVYYLTAWALD